MPRASKTDTTQPESLHDIEAEAGELADDQGNVDKEDVEALGGALNAEAVAANRRAKNILGKKRAGTKNVAWGQENACLLYDQVIQLYPPASMTVQVSRLSGSPATWYVVGQPRSGAELYAAIQKQCHGRAQETEYKVTMADVSSHMNRGVGRITLPSTLDEAGSPPAAQPGAYAPSPAVGVAAPPTVPAPQRGPRGEVWVPELQSWCMPVGAAPVPPPPTATAPPAPAPAAPAAPPMSPPPPGAVFHVPGYGWVQPAQAPAPAPPPAAPLTPAQQWGAALGTVKEVVGLAQQASSLIPGAVAAPAPEPEDESPIVTIDLGDYRVVQNKRDGSIRPVETALANGEKIFSWIERQQREYQNHQARLQQQQAPQAAPGQLSSPQVPSSGGAATPAPASTASPANSKQRMAPPSIPGLG